MSPTRSYPKRIHKIDEVKARSDDGLDLVDDLGNLGVSIDDGGNVGIGTTDPERQLDVEDDSNLPQVRLTHTDDTHFAEIEATSNGTLRVTPSSRTMQIDTGDGQGGNLQFTKSSGIISGGVSWDTGDKDITIYSEADLKLGAGGSDPDVFVDDGGHVGINCTTAERRLDVEDGGDVPQARLTYANATHYSDLYTTSNGTFRVIPTGRKMQVDTGDANGGNVEFTKSGGIVSGGISWDTGDKDVTVYSEADLMLGAGGSSAKVFIDNGGDVGIGLSTPKTKLTVEGAITLKEQAAADDDTDDYGQVWVKSGVAPNQLFFTTDAGDDIQLTSGTSIAGSGGGDVSAGSTFTTSQIIMVCDGDDKTIDEPSGTISTNDQALTVGSNTGIRVGDGSELEISCSAGNDIKFRGHGSNNDMIFALSDGGTETEIMRLDGADPAVEIKGGAVSSGIIRVYEDSDNGTDAVSLTVPASLAASYTLTLPTTDGSADGEVLATDGSGVLSWATPAVDRFTVSARYRIAALGTTTTRYFTRDVDASAEHFYIVYAKAVADPYLVDMDWISGYETGPQFMAPRACKLTQITASSKLKGTGSDCRIHVFKATVGDDVLPTSDATLVEIGTADMGPGTGSITDSNVFTVNQAITSGNTIAAGQAVVVGLAPVGGTITASSYMALTLEFEVT